MLLNILHTIAITCAVGTNFYIGKPIQKQEPSKANNVYNYNLANNGTLSINIDKNVDNDPIFERIEWNYGNSYIDFNFKADWGTLIDQATTIDWIAWDRIPNYHKDNITDDTTLVTYTHSGNREAVTNSVVQLPNEDINVTGWERLIYFKYNPNGRTLDNTININYWLWATLQDWNGNTWTNEQTEVYIKQLTTRSDKIEPIFTKTINTYEWSEYITTNNLIDVMDNFIYDIGINSTVSTDLQTIVQDGGSTTLDIGRDAIIYDNEPTYIMIYLQPRVVSTNNNQTLRALPHSDWLGYKIDMIYQGSLYFAPTGTTEIVDIPGTMIYVLGMPFTFISTAFNLTIFPNTAYEVNLSTLFLGILAVLVFVFLIKLIIGGISKGGGE